MTNKNNAYSIVNFIFVVLIGIALGYSYFFYPNNHPIGCIVKSMTGKSCSTCGFSRAFSAFTHFQFAEGKVFNKYAFGCFLFLVSQFFFRLTVLCYSGFTGAEIKRKYIILETVLTILFFLVVFGPLLLA
ncbi:MAG: DUF2752 domain-containing protein [Bacteroidetes bacterium]|nr:DUF2752 domain-containing protein [Bacteroidota bacterium]